MQNNALIELLHPENLTVNTPSEVNWNNGIYDLIVLFEGSKTFMGLWVIEEKRWIKLSVEHRNLIIVILNIINLATPHNFYLLELLIWAGVERLPD